MATKYYVRYRDSEPSIVYRSGDDGDFYISAAALDWTPDEGDRLLGMLIGGEYDLDGLAPGDVDATVARIRARAGVSPSA